MRFLLNRLFILFQSISCDDHEYLPPNGTRIHVDWSLLVKESIAENCIHKKLFICEGLEKMLCCFFVCFQVLRSFLPCYYSNFFHGRQNTRIYYMDLKSVCTSRDLLSPVCRIFTYILFYISIGLTIGFILSPHFFWFCLLVKTVVNSGKKGCSKQSKPTTTKKIYQYYVALKNDMQ